MAHSKASALLLRLSFLRHHLDSLQALQQEVQVVLGAPDQSPKTFLLSLPEHLRDVHRSSCTTTLRVAKDPSEFMEPATLHRIASMQGIIRLLRFKNRLAMPALEVSLVSFRLPRGRMNGICHHHRHPCRVRRLAIYQNDTLMWLAGHLLNLHTAILGNPEQLRLISSAWSKV